MRDLRLAMRWRGDAGVTFAVYIDAYEYTSTRYKRLIIAASIYDSVSIFARQCRYFTSKFSNDQSLVPPSLPQGE